MLRLPHCILAIGVLVPASHTASTEADAACLADSGNVWQNLLDPASMSDWQLTPTYRDRAPWRLDAGVYQGTGSWVGHERVLGDFVLQAEFFFSGESQGGIVLRGDRESGTPWLSGYELDIDGARDGQGHVHFPCHPQSHVGEALFEPGDWHTVTVEARGDSIAVYLDGQEAIRFVDDRYRYGQICLEGESEGVRYRGIRVRPLEGDPPTGARSPWTELFDGRSMTGWSVSRGLAQVRGGVIVLDGRAAPSTITHERQLPDGLLEADVWRREGDGDGGHYAIGMRGLASPDSSQVQVRCWPSRTDVQRLSLGAAATLQATTVTATRWPEYWRFSLDGGSIQVHRFGEPVLTFTDPSPQPGTVALTADGCLVEIRGFRYRPLEP